MTEPANPSADLDLILDKVQTLLARLGELEDENASLKNAQEQLVSERANLVSKNEQARARVEAMISRLKSLEQGA